MTPSEIADWLSNRAEEALRTHDNIDFVNMHSAAATIRELEARAAIAESMVAEANCSLFGSQSFFGDDKMHLSQAIEALKLESGNRWRALKIATEALEGISKGNRGDFESADLMAFDKLMCAAQALARIKEVGDVCE